MAADCSNGFFSLFNQYSFELFEFCFYGNKFISEMHSNFAFNFSVSCSDKWIASILHLNIYKDVCYFISLRIIFHNRGKLYQWIFIFFWYISCEFFFLLDAMTDGGSTLSVAVVCSSNQNRSMEAHSFLRFQIFIYVFLWEKKYIWILS